MDRPGRGRVRRDGDSGRGPDHHRSRAGRSVGCDPVASAHDDPQGQELAEESEPDVRFTYANERTFLAWNRTALALVATGVAATQLLPSLHVAGGRRLLGLPLIVLGAVVGLASYRYWRANERAMRRGAPLPRSRR